MLLDNPHSVCAVVTEIPKVSSLECQGFENKGNRGELSSSLIFMSPHR
jgi:hypothetical protein